ncbi:hypothetical protein SATMO3_59360 [Sporomusa aerivorans]
MHASLMAGSRDAPIIKGVQQVLPNKSNCFAEEKAKFEIKRKLYETIEKL